jgi:hypothetical protein
MAGGHGDTGRMGTVRHILAAALPTPRKSDSAHGPEMTKAQTEGTTGCSLRTALAMGSALLPTPTATQYGSQSYPSDPSRKRPSLNTLIATPRKTDGERGGRGDVLSQLRGYPSKHAGMMGTPTANPAPRGSVLRRMKNAETSEHDAWDRAPNPAEMLMVHTPTKTANMTAPSMMKWASARALAEMLASHGLSGTAALPITYGWMMGYPLGWLTRALKLALDAGLLRQALSSKHSATR